MYFKPRGIPLRELDEVVLGFDETEALLLDNLAKVAEQYLRKGSKVYIEGQLETRKWQDQSGQDRYTTEISLRPFRSELTMLDGRGEGEQGDRVDRPGEQQQPQRLEPARTRRAGPSRGR